jgi:hypothetical protein
VNSIRHFCTSFRGASGPQDLALNDHVGLSRTAHAFASERYVPPAQVVLDDCA